MRSYPPPCDSKVPFPELRELIRLARAYVANQIHFSEVCCAVGPFHDAAKFFCAAPTIQQMAAEWKLMAIRVWPEWEPVDDVITEAEFKRWVQAQLSVFEPADFSMPLPKA